jgi:hypothetical protein
MTNAWKQNHFYRIDILRVNQMNIKLPLSAVGLLIGATSFNANAVLTSFIGAGNVGLVYSSVSDVTWTQDANLFKTMYDADNSLISQIASVTPSYNDPSWGVQTIDAGDFIISDGRMNWWGGLAFTNYLNSINYGGSSQWRLPSAGANPQFGFNQTGGELGQLYFNELNRLAYPGTNGSDYGILGHGTAGVLTSGNAGPFTNAQTWAYWLATEYAPDPFSAWDFNTIGGAQGSVIKKPGSLDGLYAWAVSPGQVAAVPVPGAVWLMGSALIGLLASKRRGHAG